jgi:ABC-type Mn2+/Zn2+ transport system ATPase subunit
MATIDEFVLKKILVFDESTESVDIATNEKILLLGEYSKVKLF